MFDVGRFVAFAWALSLALRERAWRESAILVIVLYADALQVASGFTVRAGGPMEPAVALILALIGPSCLPRGPLPAGLPLGNLTTAWPVLTEITGALLLLATSSRLTRRAAELPMREQTAALRIDRLALAMTFYAVMQGLSAMIHALPRLLGADIGSGRLDL